MKKLDFIAAAAGSSLPVSVRSLTDPAEARVSMVTVIALDSVLRTL